MKEADLDKHDVPLPELPVLHPGESMDQSFSLHNERPRRSFSFHVLADGKELPTLSALCVRNAYGWVRLIQAAAEVRERLVLILE